MTSPPSRRHRPQTLPLVALLGLAALNACTGNPLRAEVTPATMAPPTISYTAGALLIADTQLSHFPNYKTSELFKAPPGWHGTAEIALENALDRPSHPVIAAVIFTATETRRVIDNPGAFIQHAESMLYDTDVPTTSEGVVKGTDRKCVYRTKHGLVHSDGTTGATGVILAWSDAAPAIGVSMHGFDSDVIQRLTVDVASDLCP